MLKGGRTAKYAIYRACERFNIDPKSWDTYNVDKQAKMIAYSQIRELEEITMFNGRI